MKKVLFLLLISLLIITFGCKKKSKISFELKDSEITMMVGDTCDITPIITGVDSPSFSYHLSRDNIIKVSAENIVTALSEGEVDVTITLKENEEFSGIIKIKVEKKPKITISGPTKMMVGDEITLTAELENIKGTLNWSVNNPSIATINNGKLTALDSGTVIVTCSSGDVSDTYSVNISKNNPTAINMKLASATVKAKTTYLVEYTLVGENVNEDVLFTSSNEEIATVDENGLVSLLKEGKVTITVMAALDETIKDSMELTVQKADPEEIRVTYSDKMEAGSNQTISCEVLPADSNSNVKVSSSNTAIISVTGKVLKALKEGKVKITVASSSNSEIKKEIEIEVKAASDPEFEFADTFVKDIKLNWNTAFDPLAGISAKDDFDGDLTSKIKVTNPVDNKTYGKYTVQYSVSDAAGHTVNFDRTVEVIWNYQTKFIGHGGSFFGVMNSEAAILYALKDLHYQCVEVDLAQTSDGVFVLSHDAKFGDYTIANTPWATLKDVEITQSRNSGLPSEMGMVTNSPYTTKICTLATYLQLCKQYNAMAVIELKASNGITNSSQTRMPALMEEIKKYDMLDNVIFLGSQYNCLIWVKQNGYEDIECQYLVNSIESEDYLNRCITYGFSISTNVTYGGSNSDEWIARYKENDIKISTWTFSQYNTLADVQQWIDKGVDYVTCDWHPMDKLTHYEISNEPVVKHTVTFKDYDGRVIKEAIVKDGKTAAPPANPTRDGYNFIGWDKSLKNVTEDMEVTAQYEIITYTITYIANNVSKREESWPDKESFLQEFYTDLFNYMKDNVEKIDGLSVSNGTYTFTRNSKTATFTDVASLRQVDIYDFERTCGAIIYKPIPKRNADGTANIEFDENYFLNSSKYRDKYIYMDQYFYLAVKNNYTSYSDTYQQASSGRVQIMFRFHQWNKGTNIPVFDKFPDKVVSEEIEMTYTLPTVVSFTIEDEIDLLDATGSYPFLGWYLTSDGSGEKITKIAKGTTGNIILYAKWNFELI